MLFLQLQSKGDFGFESPFQMPTDVADAKMQDPKILAFMSSNKQFKTYEDAEKHLQEIGKI